MNGPAETPNDRPGGSGDPATSTADAAAPAAERPSWAFSGRRGNPVDLRQRQPSNLPPEVQKSLQRIAHERTITRGGARAAGAAASGQASPPAAPAEPARQAADLQPNATPRAAAPQPVAATFATLDLTPPATPADAIGAGHVSTPPVSAAPMPVERRAARPGPQPAELRLTEPEPIPASALPAPAVPTAPGPDPAPEAAAPAPSFLDEPLETTFLDAPAATPPGDPAPGADAPIDGEAAQDGALAPARPRRQLSEKERRKRAQARAKRRKELAKQEAKASKRGTPAPTGDEDPAKPARAKARPKPSAPAAAEGRTGGSVLKRLLGRDRSEAADAVDAQAPAPAETAPAVAAPAAAPIADVFAEPVVPTPPPIQATELPTTEPSNVPAVTAEEHAAQPVPPIASSELEPADASERRREGAQCLQQPAPIEPIAFPAGHAEPDPTPVLEQPAVQPAVERHAPAAEQLSVAAAEAQPTEAVPPTAAYEPPVDPEPLAPARATFTPAAKEPAPTRAASEEQPREATARSGPRPTAAPRAADAPTTRRAPEPAPSPTPRRAAASSRSAAGRPQPQSPRVRARETGATPASAPRSRPGRPEPSAQRPAAPSGSSVAAREQEVRDRIAAKRRKMEEMLADLGGQRS